MNRKYSFSLFDLNIYLYLLLPAIIFIVTWTHVYVFVPVIMALVFSLMFLLKNTDVSNGSERRKLTSVVPSIIVVLLILLVFCLVSGIGGFVSQTDDWKKHNFMIEQLKNNKWPVSYESNGNFGIMTYYLGAYIIPSLVGKLFNSVFAADIANLIWSLIGLYFVVELIARYLKVKKITGYLLIAIILCIFTTFVVPVSEVFYKIYPSEAFSGYYYFSSKVFIQYYSSIENMSWAYTHTIWGWLCAALFLNNINNKRSWGMIILPCVFYSVFSFIGLISIAFIYFVIELITNREIKKSFKDLFSLTNVLSLPLFLVFFFYLITSFKGAENAAFKSGLIFEFKYLHTYIFFSLIWLLWVFVLIKFEWKNKLLYAVSLFLLILPMFSVGEFNDLCIRASIPALFILMVHVMKLLLNDRVMLPVKVLLMGLIVLFTIPKTVASCLNAFENGVGYDMRNPAFTDIDTFAHERGEFVRYQYYNWEIDDVYRFIFKI